MNLIIEVPDKLAPSLEGIAATLQKSIQQLALERLSSRVTGSAPEPEAGSPAALPSVMREPPILSPGGVDELDAAIVAGRIPVRTRGLF